MTDSADRPVHDRTAHAALPHDVAIVAGVRTPFCRAGTLFRDLDALTLGRLCCAELLARVGLRRRTIDRVVFGTVTPSFGALDIAREIVLGTELPPQTDAYTVSQACITSYQAITDAARAIALGEIECAIAGGAESASHVPVAISEPIGEALRASSVRERLAAIAEIRLADLRPRAPDLGQARDGLAIGDAAEKMAKDLGIGRPEQDELAHRSHQRAAWAWAEGRFADDVFAVYLRDEKVVARDEAIRDDMSLWTYAEAPPRYDPVHGSVTAINSAPAADGAAAVLLMRMDRARAEGLPVLGRIVAHAFGAVDPREQALIGPAHVAPIALARAGLQMPDMAIVDLHEGFAAAVLAVLAAWDSSIFAREWLGRDRSVGRVDDARLNVSGGSIALGHPIAATGARQILQSLHELGRRGEQFALCTAAAAGGRAAAIVLEASS